MARSRCRCHPTIVGWQEQLEQIARRNRKGAAQVRPLHAGAGAAIEALTHGIMNKIAHGRFRNPHHAGHPEGAHVIAAIRKASTSRIDSCWSSHRAVRSLPVAGRWVERQLTAAGRVWPHRNRQDTGDKIGCAARQSRTKGLFTRRLKKPCSTARADLAVHSLKDLPTELPAGCAGRRARARGLARCAGGAPGRPACGRQGRNSSLRRAAQTAPLRPDLIVESVRGNLDTRLRKLDAGQYDPSCWLPPIEAPCWGGRIAEILAPE